MSHGPARPDRSWLDARRPALLLLVLGGIAGAVALLFVTDRIAGLRALGSPEAFRELLVMLGVALAIGVAGTFGIGVFCVRLGRQVCREGRFPPAGARLVKSAVVHTGAQAVRRGRWSQAMGVACMLLAVGLAVAGARLIVHFEAVLR